MSNSQRRLEDIAAIDQVCSRRQKLFLFEHAHSLFPLRPDVISVYCFSRRSILGTEIFRRRRKSAQGKAMLLLIAGERGVAYFFVSEGPT